MLPLLNIATENGSHEGILEKDGENSSAEGRLSSLALSSISATAASLAEGFRASIRGIAARLSATGLLPALHTNSPEVEGGQESKSSAPSGSRRHSTPSYTDQRSSTSNRSASWKTVGAARGNIVEIAVRIPSCCFTKVCTASLNMRESTSNHQRS